MADAFENILGQPQVREFLRASVASERVTHAYLFTGPAGSNKTMAAYALAQALLCPKGPHGPRGGECGACDICRRVKRKKHPDVRYFAPEGAGGYLVDQIRDIAADTVLAPIQADRKIYILDRVDLLGVQAANAFLKTLEEPPSDVVLILLGRTRESVLPTIVSRCQVVPFRHIPASEAAGILRAEHGRVAGEGPHRHRGVRRLDHARHRVPEVQRAPGVPRPRARGAGAAAQRRRLGPRGLRPASSWCWRRPRSTYVRAAQEEELAENADFLAKSAIRQIEARNKRQLTAKSLESLRQLTAIIRSWLRDVLAVCAETPELVINVDARGAIEDAARATDEARVAAALSAVRRCDEAISYNVSPETCIDALLFETRTRSTAPARSRAPGP